MPLSLLHLKTLKKTDTDCTYNTAAFGILFKGRNSAALCECQGRETRLEFVSIPRPCFGGGVIRGGAAVSRGSPTRLGRRNHQRPRGGRNFSRRGGNPAHGHDAARRRTTAATTSGQWLDGSARINLCIVQQRASRSREPRRDGASDARGVAVPPRDGLLAATNLGLFHVCDLGQ